MALAEDRDAAEWDAFVRAQQGAPPYHLYGWRRIIKDVFGRETYYFAARVAGRIQGVLAVARLKSLLFGDFLVSLPYLNYAGVLATDTHSARLLVESACALAGRLGASHLELRHRDGMALDLPERTDKVSMLRKLPGTPEELWKALPSKVRAQVRRPQREGAVAASGGAELLADFYSVFAANMRDLGTPVYPKRFFERILHTFPDSTRVFVVRLGEEPVAGGLVVGHEGTLEIPWASSLRRANGIGVNMLLYWKVLEYACERRFSVFDFGRSTIDSGTFRFKKQWGAQPIQLHWHYWLRDGGEPPRLNPSNPKYAAAIAAWRRLPLFVANRLGPVLVKNLP